MTRQVLPTCCLSPYLANVGGTMLCPKLFILTEICIDGFLKLISDRVGKFRSIGKSGINLLKDLMGDCLSSYSTK